MSQSTGYPWQTGDELFAADLNAAFANSAAISGPPVSTAGWPFLPLSGGTVARHMTSNAADANITVNATALGSGATGPITAQMGLTINLAKDNWYTGTAAVGEIDGLSIGCRQSGTLSDCGGILINVAGTGNGFLAIDESVVQQQAVNTGAPLYGIRTQEGGMDPVAGNRIGKMLRADYGNLTTAILAINTAGQGYWGDVIQSVKDNVLTFSLDDSGNISTAGSILINSAGVGILTVQGYDASVTAAGANFMWNLGAGGLSGATYLLNNKGGGTGGIMLGEVGNTGAVTPRLTIDGNGHLSLGVLPVNAANDAAAATAGVPVGGTYRNGSALQVRIA